MKRKNATETGRQNVNHRIIQRHKDWAVFLFGIGAALILAFGCESSTELGGPGATGTGEARSENTFALTMPVGEIEIMQGETKKVTIGIDRGSEYTQPVEVNLTSPDALKVEPSMLTLAAADKSADVSVSAMSDAPVGLVTITLVGSPPSGRSVDGAIQVRIKEKTE